VGTARKQDRRSQTLYVFVGCFSGVVDKVTVHRRLDGAQRAFARYTGKPYQKVLAAALENRDFTPTNILGDKFDECKIFEASLKP